MSTSLSWDTKEASVGELAERAGVATSALRFYEREGLIHSRRTPGNQRRYSRDTLRRVAFIRASQRLGIPLADIRAALSMLPENRTPNRDDWARVSELWREDLNQRIKLMTRLRDHLTECIGCGCLSLDHCALANPYDTLGEQGPGARSLPQPCGPYGGGAGDDGGCDGGGVSGDGCGTDTGGDTDSRGRGACMPVKKGSCEAGGKNVTDKTRKPGGRNAQ